MILCFELQKLIFVCGQAVRQAAVATAKAAGKSKESTYLGALAVAHCLEKEKKAALETKAATEKAAAEKKAAAETATKGAAAAKRAAAAEKARQQQRKQCSIEERAEKATAEKAATKKAATEERAEKAAATRK